MSHTVTVTVDITESLVHRLALHIEEEAQGADREWAASYRSLADRIRAGAWDSECDDALADYLASLAEQY